MIDGEGALIFGMVYNFLPFMIYPIYNTLQKLDKSYVEAAQDLGANPMQRNVCQDHGKPCLNGAFRANNIKCRPPA